MASSIVGSGDNKPRIPRDSGTHPIPLIPDRAAIVTTINASVDSAVDIVLNSRCTLVEVNAVTQGIYIKWSATATAASSDSFVAANTVRHFVVPPATQTISVISETAGAKLIMYQYGY